MKKHLFASILSLMLLFSIMSSVTVFAQSNDTNADTTTLTDTQSDIIKALQLNPNIDFSVNTDEEEYLEMLDFIGSIGINTLVINTSRDGVRFYGSDTDTESSETYPLDSMISYASKCGFSVYLVVDMALCYENSQSAYDIPQDIKHTLSGIITRNQPAAIIFDNTAVSDNANIYAEYLEYGGGIGFDEYLSEIQSNTILSINNSIESYESNIKIGFKHDRDSTNDFECFDIEYDYTLCSENEQDEFDDTALVVVDNSQAYGKSAEYLVNRLIDIQNTADISGIVLSSYSQLVHGGESTEAVKSYFANTLDTESLGSVLSVSTPTQQSFTTKESTVIFSGTYDPNFKLSINDEEIDTQGANSFSVEYDLAVGENTFTIKSNMHTQTFVITREVNIFDAATLTPNTDTALNGLETLKVTVYAYTGSTVNATLNSQTLAMQKTSTTDGNGKSLYECTFTMPPEVVNLTQNLGRISISGSYMTSSETISGPNISVNAGKEVIVPPENDIPDIEVPDTETDGSVTQGNSVSNPAGAASGTILTITTDNTAVYPSGTTDRIPVPTQMKLAANTIDFYTGTFSSEGYSFYKTKSGRRVKTQYATIGAEGSISENNITASSVSVSGNDTVLKFKQDYKTPYTILYSPISFLRNNYGDWGDYFLSSFNPSTISIVFDYCTYASGGFDFPAGSMFTNSSWRTINVGGTTKVCLDLTLAESGNYDGVTVSYDSNGCIVFDFNGIESSLSGTVIVIDPGHGYVAPGTYDPGALGSSSGVTEAAANLGVSIYLEQKLTEMGATVIRLKTESTAYETEQRSEIARQYNPDMYISLHCNGSTSSSAQGSSTYYFHPFSYPLAASVERSLASFYTNQIHGVDKSEGARFDYFYVTTQPDFPSILVEMGYITNYREASVLIDPAYQIQIAQAIVDGIKNYFESH